MWLSASLGYNTRHALRPEARRPATRSKRRNIEQEKEKRSGKISHKYCIHKNSIEIKQTVHIITMKICWAPENRVQGEAATEPMGNADDDIICYETEYKML